MILDFMTLFANIKCLIKLVHCHDDKILHINNSKDMHEMCIRKGIKILEPLFLEKGGHSKFRFNIDEIYIEMLYL